MNSDRDKIKKLSTRIKIKKNRAQKFTEQKDISSNVGKIIFKKKVKGQLTDLQ